MLEIKVIHHPHHKLEIFDQYDPRSGTWLVSDLKSKLEIQKRFLRQGHLLAEDSVLRASELWLKFLSMGFPGHRVISADLTRALFAQWLQESEFIWARSPGAAQNLFSYCAQLLPLLVQQDGEEVMNEWWENHSESLLRWGHWYHLSKWAWAKLDESKLVPSPWVSSWLNSNELGTHHWPRKIFVDLGSELSAVESEVVWRMSQTIEVVVLRPGAQWCETFGNSLRGYRLLEEKLGLSGPRKEGRLSYASGPSFNFRKYSSMLAEVKEVVNQVRRWIESGVPVDKIVVMAPDIEEYWPVLSAYFEKEGIPTAKERLATLQSFPDILAWLAQLRVEMGVGTSVDIELSAYGEHLAAPLQYDEFKRLFTNFYDIEDLHREDKIGRLYEVEMNTKSQLNCEEFVAWASKRWRSTSGIGHLEILGQQIFQDSLPSTRLSILNWLKYAEKLCSRIEVKVAESHANGLLLLNLMSGEWIDSTHLWVMGLSDEKMRKTESAGILLSDVLSLERDLGVHLVYPDRIQAEFEVEWMLDRPWVQVFLSTSIANFLGDVQTPALMWLKRVVEAGQDWEHCVSPAPTRWDQIQELPLESLVHQTDWSPDQRDHLCRDLKIEWGLEPFVKWTPPASLSLSVTQIEAYLECPFKVAASRLLRLSDRPDLDLDVDRMGRGSLLHKIFEILTEHHPLVTSLDDEAIVQIVNRARVASDLQMADERLWPPLQGKLVDLARRFLAFESEWRRQYPLTRTLGRELEIKGRFDFEKNVFSPIFDEKAEGEKEGFLFRGKIDRVDTDDRGSLVVIDYKSSGGELRHHGSWIGNSQLQLALYSHWLELGLSAIGKAEVVAANYFVAQSMERNKGFIKAGGVDGFIDDTSRYSRIETDQKLNLFKQACEITGNVVKSILAGDLGPRPRDINQTCGRCNWKKICRAPHFN